MDEIYSQIKETFEIQEFPHAMFYEFDHALRFELGGGKSSVRIVQCVGLCRHMKGRMRFHIRFLVNPQRFIFFYPALDWSNQPRNA